MKSQINTTLEALNTAWNQALNSGNAHALAGLYAENASLSPGNGQTLVGRGEIEKLFKGFVDHGVHDHTIEILDAGGDDHLLYQVARWNARGAATDGETPSFGGITMSVFEKGGDGRWLARSHVWNAAG
ncbi:snoaL-like domain protein [mine drainage metagenome]|uniref:SnoaL-like domain protein n=1 Tax=mine drainage metagenome TaxID=410659 RepID=A0A1J5QZC4_9ZZZZ